jgi:hypothetical protein
MLTVGLFLKLKKYLVTYNNRVMKINRINTSIDVLVIYFFYIWCMLTVGLFLKLKKYLVTYNNRIIKLTPRVASTRGSRASKR